MSTTVLQLLINLGKTVCVSRFKRYAIRKEKECSLGRARVLKCVEYARVDALGKARRKNAIMTGPCHAAETIGVVSVNARFVHLHKAALLDKAVWPIENR